MKKLTFVVTLEFADKITSDNEIHETAFKIAKALEHECNSGNGLAPDHSDTYTKSIEVVNSVSETNVTINIG